eukprot:CAMPEP_0204897374 /NCGR_PEP_ID=MMETSP1397-20131031/700_1 /ASSEMBLY_ACC=CAM_ASM_000891 /TAXON_ID=49980 /ORGANISM="Climacostomum Climacostomum virens, Strain Stock W-24" /LENGTH=77 /DNA_ID=CAMNT_0052065111 /DNA_START=105 /DNA_END=338 /DNA_ORIENTATION=-
MANCEMRRVPLIERAVQSFFIEDARPPTTLNFFFNILDMCDIVLAHLPQLPLHYEEQLFAPYCEAGHVPPHTGQLDV